MARKLTPWYKAVTPREDLRTGKPLDASEFAVHLDQVRDGDAPKVYVEPEQFFARTYLTKSLIDLAAQTLRRLAGERVETSAVFNLTTQFGGGKTHALTLLYHLARAGERARHWPGVDAVLDRVRVSPLPEAATAVFVGTEFDTLSGRGGTDGTPQRRTPWGEIAYQLGGVEALKLLAEHERELTAPGGDVIRQFLPKDRPILILIDELLNYMNRGRARGLAGQVHSFIHNLSEEARRRNNLVLCVSVPASELEMTPEDHQDYDRLEKLLGRLGQPVALSEGTEISEIIRRRLFEWEGVPREAPPTIQAYADWIEDHRTQVPEWFPVDAARETFRAAYPFHPSLLSVFERKWQALPRFQRTRGVLRLLALWVSIAHRGGYSQNLPDPLIGLGTAPLGDLDFRGAAFDQLGNKSLEAAVTTDIAGSREAHAVRLDAGAVETIAEARLHQKVAVAVFFESNGGQTQDYATEPEIRLAVSEPDLDIGNVETVLEGLTRQCYYLSAHGKRYQFGLTPNLNKLLADRRASIDEDRVRERVRQEIEAAMKEGATEFVRVMFPEESSEIQDRPRLTLAVLAPEHAIDEPQLKARLRSMTVEYGTSGRTYKSAVIWCVPDSPAALNDVARRLLAWEDLDAEKGSYRLDERDLGDLLHGLRSAKSEIREAVWRTYRTLMLLDSANEMKAIDLGQATSSAAATLPQYYLNRLIEKDEVTRSVSAHYLVRKGNWPPAFEDRGWPTSAVRDAFFASPSFPRLLDAESIRETIAAGVASGLFAYVGEGDGERYDPFLYGVPLTAAEVELSGDVAILRKEAAEAYLAAREAEDASDHDGDESTDPTPDPVIGVITPPVKEADGGEDQPTHRGLTWHGRLTPQKWTNFYRQVLSRFAVNRGLEIEVTFRVRPEGGVTEQEVGETKAALRELGLDEGAECE